MKKFELEHILQGRVQEYGSGQLFICERGVEEFLPEREEAIKSAIEQVRHWEHGPEESIFLDTETCGLWGCPIFLVGVMIVSAGEIRILQFFARDYEEEASLLGFATEFASSYKMMVTFNGKTFDVPFMRNRMAFHGLEWEFGHKHLDLLTHARRKYRGTLPNCRLQTLEECVCQRTRVGDTPGHLIPQLYDDFVNTGNATQIKGIFFHNALDLIAMAELLPHLKDEAKDNEG